MYTTTSELKTLLQEEVGDTAPDPATSARYVRLLSRAHTAIVTGGGELNLDDHGNPIRRPFVFPWALSVHPKVITIEPEQTGSVDIVQGSATITNCSINAGTKNLTGWHIRFANNDTVYFVSLHSGTTLTLDSAVVSTTGAAAAFEAFKLIYTIGSDDIGLPTNEFQSYKLNGESYFISIVEPNELTKRFPLVRLRQGQPQMAGLMNQDVNGNLTIQLSHFPSTFQRLELPYVPRPADLDLAGSDPIFPNHTTVIAHLAAFYQLRKRDDDRAMSHFGTAQKLFDALTTEARQVLNANDADYGAILPWPGGFAEHSFRDILIDFE